MTIESILAVGAGVRAAATAFVPGTGQSFTLRSQDSNKSMFIIDIMSIFGVASNYSIRSPRMHDNVRGILFPVIDVTTLQCAMTGLRQAAIPQDNIQVVGGVGGGAATFDNVVFSVYYEDLVGMSGNLFKWSDIVSRVKNLLTVTCSPASSVVGDWGTAVAINATNDLFKANTNYAILGGWSNMTAMIASVNGPCTGNVLTAFPVYPADQTDGRQHFVDLSLKTDLACIPVMHSSDKAATFFNVADITALGADYVVLLAELDG